MSSDLLAKIEKIVRNQSSLDDSKVNNLINFFKNYKINYWVYPGIIKRKFSIPITDVYLLLDLLTEEGILKHYYELWCGQCQKSNGTVSTFKELQDFFDCENCGERLSALENSVLIYKVIKDD